MLVYENPVHHNLCSGNNFTTINIYMVFYLINFADDLL